MACSLHTFYVAIREKLFIDILIMLNTEASIEEQGGPLILSKLVLKPNDILVIQQY
jgi:hypothetical protein